MGSSRRRLAWLLPLALLAPALLTACGSSGENDEARIRKVIRESLMTRDPANCRRLATQRFLEQTELARGPGAVRECERDARTDKPAHSVAISRVRVDGERATARAAIRGGDDDGTTADVALVEDGDQWKLDRITAVELDFERFLRAGRPALRRPPDSLTRAQADCTIDRVRALGEQRVERAIVAGDPVPVARLVLGCIGSRELRRRFERELREGIDKAGGTRAQADCVVQRLRGGLTNRQILAAIQSSLGNRKPPRAIQLLIVRAAASCRPGAGGPPETPQV